MKKIVRNIFTIYNKALTKQLIAHFIKIFHSIFVCLFYRTFTYIHYFVSIHDFVCYRVGLYFRVGVYFANIFYHQYAYYYQIPFLFGGY